uniref:Phosphoribulokinase/uridine kinase domain-containing protein n=1 Tax=Streptomyces sp. NBC_00003 TaxID=2903608 RepID=A0AAU2VE01_9ACTN
MLLTLTGGAGAGKTTLAAALVETAPRAPVRVLHGDAYYFLTPERGVWAPDEAGTRRLDVGDPRSMDAERLGRDADAALATAAYVIVDGMFAHHMAPRSPHARFDVFVDLPADLRLARKIRRKCLSEGFPLDVLLRNYVDHRRDAHTRHIEPVRHSCDLVVDATLDPHDLAAMVWSAITNRGSTHSG